VEEVYCNHHGMLQDIKILEEANDEEMHGGERWWTIDLTNKEHGAPLDQDARLGEDYLRFELPKRNSATAMGFLKKIKVLAEAKNDNNST